MADRNAASLSVADVRSAVASASDGDTVVLPAGDVGADGSWNVNQSYNAAVVIPAGVSLKGAGKGVTNIRQAVGAGQSYAFFYFNPSRQSTSSHVKIYDFSLIGPTIESSSGYGLRVRMLPELEIYNVAISYKSSVLLALEHITQGVVYDSDFRYSILKTSYGSGGYGVAVKGAYPYTWPGSYPAFGENTNIFIEHNTFNSCKHCVQMSDSGKYVVRDNDFSEGWGPHGLIDIHGATDEASADASGLQFEIYNNRLTLSTNSQSTFYPHASSGSAMRGGRGVFYSNEFTGWGDSTSGHCVRISETDILAHTLPVYVFATDYPILWQPRDIYAWGNTYNGSPVNITEYGSSVWFQEDRESTNSMGTFPDYKNSARPSYFAYNFPHPWRAVSGGSYTEADGFEVGDADLTNGDGGYWDSGGVSGGTFVGNETTSPYAGTYCAKFNGTATGHSAYSQHNVVIGDTHYCQFMFKVGSMTFDVANRTLQMAIGRNASSLCILSALSVAGGATFKLRLTTYYDGGSASIDGASVFNVGTWYRMEICYMVHATTGGSQVWVSGVSEISDLDNDTVFANSQVNNWRISGNLGFNMTAATSYYDEVKDHTAYIGTAISEPDIDVLQSATQIADGGNFNFGSVELGDESIVTFTISNPSSTTLTLSGSPIVVLGGTHPNNFSVVSQPTSPVTAGNSTTFVMKFTPISQGVKASTIAIVNGDTGETPYNITFTGTGITPDLPTPSLGPSREPARLPMKVGGV